MISFAWIGVVSFGLSATLKKPAANRILHEKTYLVFSLHHENVSLYFYFICQYK